MICSTNILSFYVDVSMPYVKCTITNSTPNSFIYYTVDETIPDNTKQLYNGPFYLASISPKMTLKTIAIASGYDDSEITITPYARYPVGMNSTYRKISDALNAIVEACEETNIVHNHNFCDLSGHGIHQVELNNEVHSSHSLNYAFKNGSSSEFVIIRASLGSEHLDNPQNGARIDTDITLEGKYTVIADIVAKTIQMSGGEYSDSIGTRGHRLIAINDYDARIGNFEQVDCSICYSELGQAGFYYSYPDGNVIYSNCIADGLTTYTSLFDSVGGYGSGTGTALAINCVAIKRGNSPIPAFGPNDTTNINISKRTYLSQNSNASTDGSASLIAFSNVNDMHFTNYANHIYTIDSLSNLSFQGSSDASEYVDRDIELLAPPALWSIGVDTHPL